MEYYFISGTSTGIGKALCERILLKNDVKVVGLSRNVSIRHSNYNHLTIDLTDIHDVLNYNFPEISIANKIVLINNAGVLGDVGFVGNKRDEAIVNTYNINIVAPSVLMNKFIKKYKNMKSEKTIINISSGAGRHSIAAWSEYSASKSALDMFSQTIAEEQEFISENKRFNVFSIAPGVVDTPMQEQIRATNPDKFPYHKMFVNYKKNNLLVESTHVAQSIVDIIDNPARYHEVMLDLRNLK